MSCYPSKYIVKTKLSDNGCRLYLFDLQDQNHSDEDIDLQLHLLVCFPGCLDLNFLVLDSCKLR